MRKHIQQGIIYNGFNSTLVQLKGQVELDAVKPEKCFNSTLVQLKGREPDIAARC